MRAAKHHFLTHREGRKQWMAAPGHHDGLSIQQGTESARTGSTSSDREAEGRQIYGESATVFSLPTAFRGYTSSEGE